MVSAKTKTRRNKRTPSALLPYHWERDKKANSGIMNLDWCKKEIELVKGFRQENKTPFLSSNQERQ